MPFVRTSVDHGTALELAGRGTQIIVVFGRHKITGRILKTGVFPTRTDMAHVGKDSDNIFSQIYRGRELVKEIGPSEAIEYSKSVREGEPSRGI